MQSLRVEDEGRAWLAWSRVWKDAASRYPSSPDPSPRSHDANPPPRSPQPLPWLLRQPFITDARAVLLGDTLFALACVQLGLTTSARAIWLALPPLVVGLSVLRSLPASLVSKVAVGRDER